MITVTGPVDGFSYYSLDWNGGTSFSDPPPESSQWHGVTTYGIVALTDDIALLACEQMAGSVGYEEVVWVRALRKNGVQIDRGPLYMAPHSVDHDTYRTVHRRIERLSPTRGLWYYSEATNTTTNTSNRFWSGWWMVIDVDPATLTCRVTRTEIPKNAASIQQITDFDPDSFVVLNANQEVAVVRRDSLGKSYISLWRVTPEGAVVSAGGPETAIPGDPAIAGTTGSFGDGVHVFVSDGPNWFVFKREGSGFSLVTSKALSYPNDAFHTADDTGWEFLPIAPGVGRFVSYLGNFASLTAGYREITIEGSSVTLSDFRTFAMSGQNKGGISSYTALQIAAEGDVTFAMGHFWVPETDNDDRHYAPGIAYFGEPAQEMPDVHTWNDWSEWFGEEATSVVKWGTSYLVCFIDQGGIKKFYNTVTDEYNAGGHGYGLYMQVVNVDYTYSPPEVDASSVEDYRRIGTRTSFDK